MDSFIIAGFTPSGESVLIVEAPTQRDKLAIPPLVCSGIILLNGPIGPSGLADESGEGVEDV